MPEKIFHVMQGYIEPTVPGSKLYSKGITGFTVIQHGKDNATLEEAFQEARECEGDWIQEKGYPAHLPTRTYLKK